MTSYALSLLVFYAFAPCTTSLGPTGTIPLSRRFCLQNKILSEVRKMAGGGIVASSYNREEVIYEPKTQFQQQQFLPLHLERQQSA